MTLDTYTHIENTVGAIKHTRESSLDIITILAQEAINGLLALLSIEWNNATGSYNIKFRYKTKNFNDTIALNDFLCQLNEGQYVVFPEKEFLSQYINTSLDPVLTLKQSPKQSMVEFIKKFYPASGINTEADLTISKLEQIAEALNMWYDSKVDLFDIKFTDCAITDPTGLSDILKAFPSASFMKDTTTFNLNFNNGAFNAGDPNVEPNLFNFIGLQLLIGELKKLPKDLVKRLVSISFLSLKPGVIPAIAPSVTNDQWLLFCNSVMSFTGITSQFMIRR